MTPRSMFVPAGALAVVALVTACSASVNTEPDETAIVYLGARGSATKFNKCVGPVSRAGVSASDNSWTYPAGQRTFDFTGGKDAESKPLTVVSKDNVQLTVPGFSTFALNTDCKVLQQFHERIGLKYSAFFYSTDTDYSETGWVRMLNVYFKQPLDRAMDAASQEFEWKKLYNDPATKQAWEQRVGTLAGQFITEAGGGQFFCAPNYTGKGACGQITLTLQKPEPPANLVEAMAAEQAAKVQNEAQRQINAKVDTELESMAKLVKLLGPDAYVRLRAVQDGRVQIVVTGGESVTVAPK